MKCGICGYELYSKHSSFAENTTGPVATAEAYDRAVSAATAPEPTTARDIEDLASYMRGYADAMELYASLLEELAGFNG